MKSHHESYFWQALPEVGQVVLDNRIVTKGDDGFFGVGHEVIADELMCGLEDPLPQVLQSTEMEIVHIC